MPLTLDDLRVSWIVCWLIGHKWVRGSVPPYEGTSGKTCKRCYETIWDTEATPPAHNQERTTQTLQRDLECFASTLAAWDMEAAGILRTILAHHFSAPPAQEEKK